MAEYMKTLFVSSFFAVDRVKKAVREKFSVRNKKPEVLKKERNKNERKVIKNIVHVNAHTGKRERYEEIEKC